MERPLRFLMLEDNRDDAELLEFELEEAGFDYVSRKVMTEEEFLCELREFLPDIILSDYDLPTYSGAKALAAARTICPNVPFILVTGAISEDRAIDTLTSGAKDYVMKTRLHRLVPAIKRALAEAEEHNARRKAEKDLRDAHRELEKQVAERTSELQESRERLSLALTSSKMGIFEWDIIENKRYWDNNVHLLLGTSPERFTGTAADFFQVVHPEDRVAAQDSFKKAVDHDDLYETDYRAVWPDGSVHYIAVRGKVHHDDTGRPVRIIGVCWDVTERRKAEEALRQNEQELREANARTAAILTGIADVFYSLDDNWRVTVVNPAAERALFGQSADKLLGRVIWDMFPALVGTRTQQRFFDVAEKNEMGHYEAQSPLNGRWYEAFMSPRQGGIDVYLRDIDKRKQAENALREALLDTETNRSLLEAMFAAQNDVVLIFDTAMNVQKANKAFSDNYGFDPTGLNLGNLIEQVSCLRLSGEPLLLADQPPTARALKGENVTGVRFLVKGTGGTDLAIEVSSGPIKKGDQITGAATVWHDITNQVKSEAALRESEKMHRTIVETANEGILMVDSYSRTTYVNNSMAEMLGFAPNELIGRKITDFFDPEYLSLALSKRESRQLYGTRDSYEAKLICKDNSSVWVLLNTSPLLDESGKFAGTLGMITNITKRKKADDIINELTKRLNYHVNNSPLAVIEWGPDMRLTRWSAEAERIFGWHADEVLGKRMEEFRWIYREDESHVAGVSEDLQKGTDPRRFSINRNYRKDGSIIYCEWYNSSMLDESGNLQSILSLILDVTKRKQAEMALSDQAAKLQERTAQLEEINRELENFGYSVSHDLRAPLRAIEGYTRMILKKQGDKFDEDTLAKFNTIRSSAETMGQTIDALLEFSRLGRKALTVAEVDMAGLLMNVWQDLQGGNPDREMILKVGALPSCRGDKNLLRQVYANLLANAVKFTRQKEKAQIEAAGYKEGSEQVYYVRDNGAGFDMEYGNKLFGMFRRLHRADEFEGTGVGLAAVSRIIHKHGGRVWAEGKVNEGATFYFTLPSSPAER